MLNLIGFASGFAAGNQKCEESPDFIKYSNLLKDIKHEWLDTLYPKEEVECKYARTYDICSRLADTVRKNIQKNLVILGGDHSSAIGTWSGAVNSHHLKNKRFGLIWLDAHMDAHTSLTSPSNNIHGMPLAALMGYGKKELTSVLSSSPKINPENVFLIGVRSYEKEEYEFLKKLGVHIYYSNDIHYHGIQNIMERVLKLISENTDYYGLSIDLDVIDSQQVKAVGTPERNGIDAFDLINSLSIIKKNIPLITEIVEFNPSLDNEGATAIILKDIIKKISLFERNT